MKTTIRKLHDLDTPCLVLDTDILERNLRKMQDVVARAGKAIRPHAKTHKCSALARRQIEVGAVGVCAAKVSEAEALVKAGLQRYPRHGPRSDPGQDREAGRVFWTPRLP